MSTVTLLLAAGAAGCSGGSPEKKDTAPAPAPSSSPTISASPAPASAPLRVRVTRVAGRLPARVRPALEKHVASSIQRYVDGAFLGEYPRSSFPQAFVTFTRGARAQGVRQATLLTNKTFGPTTTSVRTARGTAYLSVLAPNRVAVGVTARVDLVFAVERGDAAAQKVHLQGRLLMTRSGGTWKIFGYDLARSQAPVGSSS